MQIGGGGGNIPNHPAHLHRIIRNPCPLKPGCRKVYFGTKYLSCHAWPFKQFIDRYGNQKRRTVTVFYFLFLTKAATGSDLQCIPQPFNRTNLNLHIHPHMPSAGKFTYPGIGLRILHCDAMGKVNPLNSCVDSAKSITPSTCKTTTTHLKVSNSQWSFHILVSPVHLMSPPISRINPPPPRRLSNSSHTNHVQIFRIQNFPHRTRTRPPSVWPRFQHTRLLDCRHGRVWWISFWL